MTDTATARYGARQQSQGSNTNTWGDDKLNEVLRLLDRGGKGVQTLAMTGDTTVSWTNYAATNDGQVSVLILTGSLSSPANLTMPSREWAWSLIKNATSQTITVKTAAGAGVAIPGGRQIAVYCDGADCSFAGPNYIGSDITEANARDLMDKAGVEAAIANANLPATAGTVLNSATDTTANYLINKIAVAGDLAISTQNQGGAEKALITQAPYWNTPRVVQHSDSPVTVLDKDIILMRTSTGTITLNAPATGRFQFEDVDGQAAVSNASIAPQTGDSIMDGGANDIMTVDIAWFSATCIRRPSGTNWSVA